MSRRVLNKLLDKFERSKQKENIHISIRMTKRVIPEYFDLNSEEYLSINNGLLEAESLGLITLDWKDNRPGHIIERVRLVPENVVSLFKYLNRKPKGYRTNRALNLLEVELEKYSDSLITKNFISYLISSLKNNRSVSQYFDLNNLKDLTEFLSILYKIESNQELLYLREFSGKATGDTKFIENNLNRFINVLYKFSDLFDSKDNELILNYFNIYRNPIFVFLKGKVELNINSEVIDLSKLTNGIAISSQDLEKISVKDVNSVLTVENLTTYNRVPLEPNTLILYSRGFANSELIYLLKRIREENKHASFYHFGDIDVGGFLILIDLIQKTETNFQPILMDSKTLIKYSNFSKSLTINDKKRLKRLIESINEYNIEVGTKESILNSLLTIQDRNIKLEQEVINLNVVLIE